MSWRLPPVSVHASGVPRPSVRRWCLEPGRPLSTGLGPVLPPLFSPGSGSNQQPRATSQAPQPRATRPTAARVAAATPRPAATAEAAANRSYRTRSQAPAANAPRRSRYAEQTRSRSERCGHRPAADPDTETDAPKPATTARPAPTTHPKPPTATRASASPISLTTDADGVRPQQTGPFILLEALRTRLKMNLVSPERAARRDPASSVAAIALLLPLPASLARTRPAHSLDEEPF